MPKAFDIGDFLELGTPVLDVRSPSEFAKGHIPGAISMPLFEDAERALVGTCYKQEGRDAAVLLGLKLVGPKLAPLVELARQHAPGGRVRVHCWRGGERSGSVAWLLEKAGFQEVVTLRGGYKAFRNHVLASFAHPIRPIMLGGFTGAGKTGILKKLRQQGEQVIDLEALANHKGSSFGGFGQEPQPSTEHFENLLWSQITALDPHRPIWFEDESPMIGRVRIPDALFAQLFAAPLCVADVPIADRVQRLVDEYGTAPKELLAEAIERIRKRLGPQHGKTALLALEDGDLHTVARTVLQYYDKTYAWTLDQRARPGTVHFPASAPELSSLIDRLLHHACSIYP